VRGPCRRFIGENKGGLRVIAAEKPWVKDTKPSWKRVESKRTRMEHVLSELWRLVEYRLAHRSKKCLKTRRPSLFESVLLVTRPVPFLLRILVLLMIPVLDFCDFFDLYLWLLIALRLVLLLSQVLRLAVVLLRPVPLAFVLSVRLNNVWQAIAVIKYECFSVLIIEVSYYYLSTASELINLSRVNQLRIC
jgi:hypothetical protein